MNSRPGPARRPLIVRIITRLNIGGPARQAVMLSTMLDRAGFRSELVFGQEEPEEGRIPSFGAVHTRLPSLRRRIDLNSDVSTARALSALLKARRPQIVHTHMAKAGALGRFAARRARVPVIVHTFHGHVLEGYFSPFANRAFIEVERYLARRSDALVAVSSTVRDELMRLGIGESARWHVIPVGLNLDPYLASRESKEGARARLGLGTTHPIVGMVGRLVPIKDVATFIEAATRVVAGRPEVEFVIAGDGELRAELEIIARRRLGPRVRFLGWVSNLVALYRAIDVLVVTSRMEGTPTSLVEAAASTVPAVATRVGGVPDVVRDGETGFLVPAADPERVAREVIRLLDDEVLRRSAGEAARKWVRQRFSIERLTDDLAELYGDLLARKATDRP